MNFMMENSLVRSHLRNFQNFDRSNDVTKYKLGAKRGPNVYLFNK